MAGMSSKGNFSQVIPGNSSDYVSHATFSNLYNIHKIQITATHHPLKDFQAY